ncbi:MAG: isoaspartyl peptidase/L-asparaginase, partial [Acidobacteria bacterium]|nr:isoaspartyl peptidase/L-asparaginase [Acidobacteriota bacterium]
VAFVKNVKNPIKLARLVIEKTPHILLGGDGANQFARDCGVEFEDDAYFYTDLRYQQLLKARDEGVVELDHTAEEAAIAEEIQADPAKALGTVGAVACDSQGRLAAATSTGGMTNKKYGRVGDTPLIGAGTYADDICAVSCTGHGEYFMLGVTAFDVSARMKYKGLDLETAARETIDHLTAITGDGGLIAVDAKGNVTLPFNSEGMYRGFLDPCGKPVVEIY